MIIVDERGDDPAECRADDHADGEIEHVAAHDELSEFLEHVPSVGDRSGNNTVSKVSKVSKVSLSYPVFLEGFQNLETSETSETETSNPAD